MTARPGRIEADVAINLAHPAPLHAQDQPGILPALKARLTEGIRAEAVLAAQEH